MDVKKREKIVAVVGPTGLGKTSLAIMLAKKYEGEVISADSRQVYRDLDIGTEKATRKEMDGVPHYLIDVCDPKETFTVEMFKRKAEDAIADIVGRDKLPIIVGGTGWYIDALLYGRIIPPVPPDPALRGELEQKTEVELFELLEEKDPARAETIDRHNKRRLVRALEIIHKLGSVPRTDTQDPAYDACIIGIETDDAALREKLEKRFDKALARGLVQETKRLRDSGLSWKRIDEFGLEYRIVGRFLQGKMDADTMRERCLTELWQYVKRQRTWFKRNKDIRWFPLDDTDAVVHAIDTFLQK